MGGRATHDRRDVFASWIAWLALSLVAVTGCQRDAVAPQAPDALTAPPDGGADAGADAASDASEAGGDEVDGAPACAVVSWRRDEWLAMEVVVDHGASMALPYAPGGPSRWEAVRAVLLRNLDDRLRPMAVGLSFFPDRGSCPADPLAVPADLVLAAQRGRLLKALGREDPPAGERPAAEAYRLAVRDLERLTYKLRSRWIVLVMDGLPTAGCGGGGDPLAALIADVTAAAARGITTCVVSSPGSASVREDLRRVAAAGSAGNSSSGGCFVELPATMDPAEARFTFDGVLFPFPLEPPPCWVDVTEAIAARPDLDFERASFVLSAGERAPEVLPRETPCRQGWELSPDRRRASLCGRACDSFQEAIRGPAGSYELRVPCR
jgi:hypothetical protein